MRIKQVISEPSFKYFVIGFVVLVGLTATTIYAADKFRMSSGDQIALVSSHDQKTDQQTAANDDSTSEGQATGESSPSGDQKPPAEEGSTPRANDDNPTGAAANQDGGETAADPNANSQADGDKVILPGELTDDDNQATPTTDGTQNQSTPAAQDTNGQALPQELAKTGPGDNLSKLIAIAGVSFMLAYYYQSRQAIKSKS